MGTGTRGWREVKLREGMWGGTAGIEGNLRDDIEI